MYKNFCINFSSFAILADVFYHYLLIILIFNYVVYFFDVYIRLLIICHWVLLLLLIKKTFIIYDINFLRDTFSIHGLLLIATFDVVQKNYQCVCHIDRLYSILNEIKKLSILIIVQCENCIYRRLKSRKGVTTTFSFFFARRPKTYNYRYFMQHSHQTNQLFCRWNWIIRKLQKISNMTPLE